MQQAKKVLLVPASNKLKVKQYGGGESNQQFLPSKVEPQKGRVKSKIYDKIHKFIKIILKLARKIGYDDDLKIKLKDGKYLEKSNIVDLLTHAMSVGKVLYGENEFIELLHSADISPDLIINENVKSKLISLINKGAPTENKANIISDTEIDRRVIDRKRNAISSEDHELDDERASKRIKLNDPPIVKEYKVDKTPRESVIKSTSSLKRKAENTSKDINKRSSYQEIDEDRIDQNLWEIPEDL